MFSVFSVFSVLKNLLQSFVQHEVYLVVAEGLLELAGLRVLVDLDILDADHLSEVFPVLLGDVVGEGAVVSTTGENPCRGQRRWP